MVSHKFVINRQSQNLLIALKFCQLQETFKKESVCECTEYKLECYVGLSESLCVRIGQDARHFAISL